MILLIDNYDSFTYNLYQLIKILGYDVCVRRNDKISLTEINKLDFSHIVISPGPKAPEDSGICPAIVKKFAGIIPILGVCLGCQVIAYVFGARIIKAKEPIHGETSKLFHTGKSLFYKIPQGALIARYHSLIIEESSLPGDINVLGYADNIIMGISHGKYKNLQGVQFHPESFLTQYGQQYLNNFFAG